MVFVLYIENIILVVVGFGVLIKRGLALEGVRSSNCSLYVWQRRSLGSTGSSMFCRSMSSSSTSQGKPVNVFFLHTLRINIILATGDAVSSPGFFPEGTVSSNVAKSETSILIFVLTFSSK